MVSDDRNAIIISASSDIGAAMSLRWVSKGWSVSGTYRTDAPLVNSLMSEGVKLIRCDLRDRTSIINACSRLTDERPEWDVLVIAPGTQDPVGPFLELDFDDWEESILVNFTAQMRMIHSLLPTRRWDSELEPCVLLFAGGGTNNAPVNYSGYIISKIAQIKMCELLDAEIPSVRFVIVGPGWVKTKIHESTLTAGSRLAGDNFRRTVEMLESDNLTPMDDVLDCCDWLIKSPREQISGRNFSVVYDSWGSKELQSQLERDSDMYKLRRSGNDWKIGS